LAHGRNPDFPGQREAAAGPGLYLVKDDGVYLMSAATEPLRKEGGEWSVVAYAVGHDPSEGDCYDYDREVCGGDDFVEFIPVEALELQHPLESGSERLGLSVKIRLTERSIKIRLVFGTVVKDAGSCA